MSRDKNLKETITTKGTEITVVSGGDDNDYISFLCLWITGNLLRCIC